MISPLYGYQWGKFRKNWSLTFLRYDTVRTENASSLPRERLYLIVTSDDRLIEVEVTLRLTTVSQYVFVSSTLVGLATRYYFLSESCGIVSVWRPLWREDRSAIFSVIAQWSESRRARNHTLLSHLRLLQLGGPGPRIYILQEQDGPVQSQSQLWKSKAKVTFRLTASQSECLGVEVEVTLQLTVSQYVKVSSPLWDSWPNITFCPKVVFWNLLSCLCGAPSLTRGRVCHLSFSV
jgi:hypothetical protein